jgi:plastocyanin
LLLPQHSSLQVGDVVEWVNGDFIDHTATTESNEFDVVIPVGTTKHLVIERSGTLNTIAATTPE